MTHSFYRSYGFLAAMLACIVLGCAVGAAWPGAVCLEPLGTVFINMMFCLVVPLVFCSLAGSIANTRSRRRAGRILGATLGVFVVTGLLAAFIMLVIVRVFPPVLTPWTDAAAGTVDDPAPLATLLVNFFTVNDFSALLSRRAMLPLIVFSLLFGFSVSACGGPDTVTARVLDDATKCLLKMVSLVSCYAPIAFFGFFAAMVASYGAQITASYARAMLAYYPLCFVYALLAFPLLAYLGGGRAAAAAAYPAPRGDRARHLLVCRHHPGEYGGRGGQRHPARGRGSCAAAGRDDAHGRLVLQLRAQGRVPLRRVRPAV